MRRWVKWAAWLSFTAVIAVAGWRGAAVPFHEQWPLYEALRNTAAIIFAVIGAWLAIVYPERLKLSLRRSADQPEIAHKEGRRVVTLMTPIVHSTFILAAVLLVGIAAPLLRGVPIVTQHLELCRGLSYSLLTSLTFWQLWTVVLTLVPASDITNQANSDAALQGAAGSLFSRTPPKRKKP